MHMVNVTPIVGLPQFNGWAQVLHHTFSPGLECVCLVAVRGPHASVVGKSLLHDLTAAPPISAEELYESFESAVDSRTQQGSQVSAVVVYFTQTQSTAIAVNASLVLKRGGKFGAIIPEQSEVSQLEGSVVAGDVFIGLTADAVQYTYSIEQHFTKGFEADAVVTSLVPTVHADQDAATAAVAFMAYEPHSTASIEHQVALPEERVVTPENDLDLDDDMSVLVPAPVQSQPGPPAREQLQELGGRVTAVATQLSGSISRSFSHLKLIATGRTVVRPLLSKRQLRIGLGILLLLTIAGVVAIGTLLYLRQEKITAAATLAPYQNQFETLSQQAESDPVAGREQTVAFVNDLRQLSQAVESTGSATLKTATAELLERALALETEVSGRESVQSLPVFYDLRLAAPESLTSHAAISGSTAVFVDAALQQLLVLNLDTKQVTVVKHSQLSKTKSIVEQSPSTVTILAGGLYQINLSQPDTITEIKAEGDSNRDAKLLGSFGTYVYVLNPVKRNMYRYSLQNGSYSDPIGWLRDPLGIPYEDVTSMAIDGELWIGSSDGQIKRFQSGSTAAFSPTGMEKEFDSALTVVTSEKLENIYILEPDASRVVILTKTGQFIREVESSSLTAATQLLVSEERGKAYAVSGSIIFELSL